MNTKKIIFAFMFMLPFALLAQKKMDSTRYYEKKIYQQYKDALAQVEATASFKELSNQLVAYNKKNNSYNGFGFSVNYNGVKANSLNTSLNASGFSSFNNFAIGGGVLTHAKRGVAIVDINLFNASFINTVKKVTTDQKISLNSIDFLQTNIGIALVNKQKFSLYPYFGFGLRSSNMVLTNTQVVNPTGTNISNYLNSPQNITATSFKITYQLGLGMDIKLKNNTQKNASTFLFVKGGLNNTFGDEKFKIDDNFKFNPDLKMGGLQFQIGLKFVKFNTTSKPEVTN